MSKGIVLLSGGLDSTTLATWVKATGWVDELQAVSVFYGQKHEREVLSSYAVTKHLGIPWEQVSLPSSIFKGAQSTLVGDKLPNPHMTYQEIAQSEGVSPTYVPNRNAILISIAVAVALTQEAEYVFLGVHAEDARGWAYPDCTPEFTGAMANAAYVGTYHKVRLVTPFQWMMKRDIVKLGILYKAPFHLTWTCYEGGDKPCRKCPSCVEREEAFRVNGFQDPLLSEGVQLELGI